MTFPEIQAALLRAINDLAARGLPEVDVSTAVELTGVGEPGVAFEHVCTQLYEYDIAITDSEREILKELGTAMERKPEYWERLRRT